MIDGGLSEAQKIAMRMWLFATTDATVISDPGYAAVVRIVEEERRAAIEAVVAERDQAVTRVATEVLRRKDIEAEIEQMRGGVRRMNERHARAKTMVSILRRRAMAAEESERLLRTSLRKLIEKWEGERAEYPAGDPRAEVAGVVVNLCEEELRDVLNGKGPW